MLIWPMELIADRVWYQAGLCLDFSHRLNLVGRRAYHGGADTTRLVDPGTVRDHVILHATLKVGACPLEGSCSTSDTTLLG
jgi:hypothetical protein